MNWKDVGGLIKKSAPLLGSVLEMTGPPGKLAADMISSAFGTDPNKPEDAAALIENDPEKLLELKKLEMSHAVELKKLSITETQNYLEDRQAARQRDIEYVKKTGRADKNVIALAWLVTIGFFAALGTLLFVELAEAMTNIVYMMLGTLGTKFGDIISYYFGTGKPTEVATDSFVANGKR